MKYTINAQKFLENINDWNGRPWTTQKHKADVTGLSQSTISRLESGGKNPKHLKVSEFLAICAGMDRAPFEYLER